ncbi:MAG: penicillin-binding protein, partial [Flavobacteriaceae bacterium]|nr:penicillin-binding protein [Flavobacteriaceae bacterium]
MGKQKKIMPKKFRLYFYGFWLLFFSGIIIFSGIFYAASLGHLGEMPDFRQLENPNTNLATQIISSDNKVLGKFHFGENRIPIQFDDLPKNLIDALISTEDERFYSHSGIDFKGTLRAIVFLGKRGGASTISQQLARQLFVGVRAKNIFQALAQKFKEYVISVRLERQYTKDEIIAMYLNIYDFGYNGDGIKSASNIFFDKELDSLKVEESAVLVGMLKNSSYYNPLRRPELVKNRRNVVLNQMKKNGHLDQNTVDS